jgi:NAD(P)-dependent dehydrogenase (short-subunit alcohol dehydrogenase family)
VIITGAGRGIGRATAVAFARAGARVVLSARTQSQLEEVREEIAAFGGTALVAPADVTDAAAVQRMVADTMAAFARVDVLVNNAAANYVSSVVLSDDRCWAEILNVNVLGVYLCTKAVLPHMMRAKSGCIVNISSVAAKVGVPLNSAYSASKAAVLGFTKAVALEVAKLGITVNAICPWHVDTELMREAMRKRGALFGRSGENHTDKVIAKNPQGRLITVEEVAGLTLFLASPPARGITGQALNQCGGALTA